MKNKELTLGLCQTNVIDNKEENLKEADKYLYRAFKEDCDIAILGEMFNCPYENKKFVEYSEDSINSPTLNFIGDKAREYRMHIIAGSIPEKEDNKIYNTSFAFNDKGKIIGKHRKVHLFDIDVEDGISFKESNTLTPGCNFTLLNTKWCKIGLGICYDIRFLEYSRILTLKGASVLVFPGSFNQTTGPTHWEMLFKSRALDNQVYTVGVSPALNRNSSYHSYGHSIICNPWGKTIRQGTYNPELIVEKIDLCLIKKVRSEIPVLKNRRYDLYEIYEKNKI